MTLAAAFCVFAVGLASILLFLVDWAARLTGLPPAGRVRWTAAAALAIAGWMTATWAAAASGRLSQFEQRPPPMLLLFVAMVAVSVTIAWSPAGRRLLSLPLGALIAVQAFRLLLELLMHRAYEAGVMPVQMSYSGRNFDIVTGATAIFVGWVVATTRAPEWLPAAWNWLGAVLLANIVAIAVLSTPTFAAFGQDRLNTWVAEPPYVWLPAVMVTTAMTGHLLIARKLAQRRT